MAVASFVNYAYDLYGVEIKCSSVPDVASNSSLVTVEVVLHHPVINIGRRNDNEIGIAGDVVNYSTGKIENRASTDAVVGSYSRTIQHDADGTKQIEVYATFDYNLESTRVDAKIRTVTVRGTFDLGTIGRSSVIISQTTEIVADGSNEWFIEVQPSSDAFWHKARLSIGRLTDITEPFQTRITGTALIDWLYEMTDRKVGTMSVSIQTYTDESCTTEVGDPAATTFRVKLPADAAPTIVSGWARDSFIASSGAALGLQGLSRLNVMFYSGYVATKYGASLSGYRIELEGKSYTGPNDDVEVSIYTDAIKGSGTVSFKIYAIDSRGVETSETRSVTVYQYAKPTLKDISAYRCDSKGKPDADGEYLYFKATAVYSECGGNNKITLKAYFRQAGANYEPNSLLLTSGEGKVTPYTVSTKISYSVWFAATDTVGNTARFETTISSMEAAFHIKDGGGAAAFGKFAEYDDALEVKWRIIDKTNTEVIGARLTGYNNSGITSNVGSNQSAVVLVCDARNESVLPGLYIVNASCTWESAGTGGARMAYIEKYSSGGWAAAGCTVQNFVQEGDGITQVLTALVLLKQNEIIRVRGVHYDTDSLMVQIKYQVARIGALPLEEQEG